MNENSKLEDDLQNIWEFVKIDSQRVSLLERKIVLIEKMLSKVLTELEQQPNVIEERRDN
jgi:DNA-binding HxlR family transcriptional regulator